MEAMEEFDKQTFRFRIPAVVFLGFMLPFGVLGNASVIYIYGFRLKTSNVHLFIALLAVSDIIQCLVGIPMEMYRMVFLYNYTSFPGCKIEAFFGFSCYMCSILMLLIISVERYVKVCRSTKTQMSRKLAKILVGGAFLSSSIMVIPLAVFAVPSIYTLDNGITVRNCTYYFEPEVWWYVSVYWTVLISVLITMFILYRRVSKTAEEHVTWTIQRRARPASADSLDMAEVPKPKSDKKLSKTNRTVMWITAVYATSCIPIFTIAIVQKFFTHFKAPNSLDYFLFFFYQSWILNCTLNPIVYGFLNSKFRTEFRDLVTSLFVRVNMSNKDSRELNTGSTDTV